MLDSLVGLLPAGPASVLVDGDGDQPTILASRLAAALSIAGRPCYRLPGTESGAAAPDAARPCISATAIRLADGARWHQVRRWDVVMLAGICSYWYRTFPGRPPRALRR